MITSNCDNDSLHVQSIIQSLWKLIRSSLQVSLLFSIHIFFAYDYDRSAIEWDVSNDENEDQFYAHESLFELLQQWVD